MDVFPLLIFILDLKIRSTVQCLHEWCCRHAVGSTELTRDRYLVPSGRTCSMRTPAGSPEGQRSLIGEAVATLCGGLKYPEHLSPLWTPDCKNSSYLSV